jgi:caffeoyl-CoA O-methyltransferase
MPRKIPIWILFATVCAASIYLNLLHAEDPGSPSSPSSPSSLDTRVRQFLDSNRGTWRDMNVPEVDGRALHDIVLEHKYKNALEIGTSTGYSGVWIAWALSKTGGKLITVEIDKGRYEEAVANFRAAGLEKFVDARLGDAHEIVPALPGPFDFVFCDADKDWYDNYLSATVEKIRIGGCFTAHNVFDRSSFGFGGRGRGRGGMVGDYLEFARSFSFLDTKVLDMPGTGGLAVSYKKEDK